MKRRFYKATSVAAWLPVLMLFFASTSAYGQKKESVDVMMIYDDFWKLCSGGSCGDIG